MNAISLARVSTRLTPMEIAVYMVRKFEDLNLVEQVKEA